MIQPKRAIALAYEPEVKTAPYVSARGERQAAQQLIALARRYGVPVVRHPELVDQLDPLAVDQEIPDTLFPEVAELFVQL